MTQIDAKFATEPGYYWWLPLCAENDNPENWIIVSFHPMNTNRVKSGTLVGPLVSPRLNKEHD